MDSTMIDTHLENLDRRLAKMEQILPTLATKEEIATLASNVDTLATKEELRAGLLEEGERSRRYMDIIAESLRSDIQLLAGHLASEMSKRLGL